MATIEIDFEVYKELTARRAAEAETYNDVLRGLLHLPVATDVTAASTAGWTCKGITLPEGTELRGEHKGQVHTARIQAGAWLQDGKTYNSPSGAAFAKTGYGINGWWYWFAKKPGEASWTQLAKLRGL